MRNSIFLFGIGIAVSSFRYYIDGRNGYDLVLIMAIINIIAFNYVLLLILADIKQIVYERLEQSSLPIEQQNACKKKTQDIVIKFSWAIFVILSIVYIFRWRSSALNDALSIMALVFSISEDRISEYFSEIVYKII